MERADVSQVFRDYPRIYFACHRRHVRDPQGGTVLSSHQASILDHLDAIDPTTLGDLADHMGVTPGTMSVAVDRLARQGYVTRTPDVVDRRRVHLRLTDDGVRVKSANSVLDPDLVAAMLDQLEEGDRSAALAGLEHLAKAAGAAQRVFSSDAGRLRRA
jgi:MarR family transcriptional regulator, organic hydroperoxide resistance regulator